jgi:hypothetical protein
MTVYRPFATIRFDAFRYYLPDTKIPILWQRNPEKAAWCDVIARRNPREIAKLIAEYPTEYRVIEQIRNSLVQDHDMDIVNECLKYPDIQNGTWYADEWVIRDILESQYYEPDVLRALFNNPRQLKRYETEIYSYSTAEAIQLFVKEFGMDEMKFANYSFNTID